MFKMTRLSLADLILILNYIFIFTFLECSFCVPVKSQEEKELRIIRTDVAYGMFKSRTCKQLLISSSNCSQLKRIQRSDMHVYIAEKNVTTESFMVRAVSAKKATLRNIDSVLVIDPTPDAHYGHEILIFLMKAGITKDRCDRRGGEHYITQDGKSECMYTPTRKLCKIASRWEHRKRRGGECSFHFFPKVFKPSTPRKSELKCLSSFNGFRACPINSNDLDNQCSNLERCLRNKKTLKQQCFLKCDYAVMISGGWDNLINRYRHYLNVKDMWRHLQRKRGYRYDHIKVFFANNSTVDLDGNPKTIETEPAVESVKILNHINHLCTKKSRCVDTLTLYLNGPTFQNGDMLLWDSNKDGQAKDLEILKINDILESISSCGAQNIVIIADQNYGGHIIEKIESLRRTNKNYNKVHVITASSKESKSYNRHFTKGFIDYDDIYIDDRQPAVSSRPLKLIYQSLKERLPKFDLRYLPGTNIDDISVTGRSSSRTGCTSNIGNG